MDKFDELIKEKINKENWKVPSNIDERIMKTTDKLENKNKKFKNIHKILAAAVILILATSIVGKDVIPSAQEVIKSFVSYFEGKNDSAFSGDMENIEKFNKNVGVSTYDSGIKITLDNILVDDNYIMTYYTVVSDNPVKELMTKEENKVFFDYSSIPFIDYSINGEQLKYKDSEKEGYFLEDNIFKYVVKESMDTEKFGDIFKLKISIDSIFGSEGKWELEADVDKGEVKKSTVVKNLDLQVNANCSNIERKFNVNKVLLSPLGSKIYYKSDEDLSFMKYMYALRSDKGIFLDIVGDRSGEIEFLNKDKDMQYIDMVPLIDSGREPEKPIKDLADHEIILAEDDNGKLIIENVKFDTDRVSIKYRIEGYFLFTDEFVFYDKDGNRVDNYPGGIKRYIDKSDNTYTTSYIAYNDQVDFSQYAKIGLYGYSSVGLDEENSVRIPLN